MPNLNVVRILAYPGIIMGFAVLATVSALEINLSKLEEGGSDNMGYLPRAEQTKILSLGHSEAIASAVWVNSLIEYGGSLYSGKEYRWLSQSADIVTTLDSLFYRTYYYLGALTPLNSEDTLDFKVMQRGIRVYPNDWRIALMLSMRFSQGPLRDYNRASETMQYYSMIDTIPEYVRQISRSMKILGYPKKIALATLLEDYYNPAFAKFRKGVARRISMVVQNGQSSFRATDSIIAILPDHIESSQQFSITLQKLENLKL